MKKLILCVAAFGFAAFLTSQTMEAQAQHTGGNCAGRSCPFNTGSICCVDGAGTVWYSKIE